MRFPRNYAIFGRKFVVELISKLLENQTQINRKRFIENIQRKSEDVVASLQRCRFSEKANLSLIKLKSRNISWPCELICGSSMRRDSKDRKLLHN